LVVIGTQKMYTRSSTAVKAALVSLASGCDAVFAAHGYEEPGAYVSEVWTGRSTSPDDLNPDRWWNR
jgi:hypothetical protein